MSAMLDKLWVWCLCRLEDWMCARLWAANRREKLRWLKHELKRQDLWKN
jgi:hypothetical protein